MTAFTRQHRACWVALIAIGALLLLGNVAGACESDGDDSLDYCCPTDCCCSVSHSADSGTFGSMRPEPGIEAPGQSMHTDRGYPTRSSGCSCTNGPGTAMPQLASHLSQHRGDTAHGSSALFTVSDHSGTMFVRLFTSLGPPTKAPLYLRCARLLI